MAFICISKSLSQEIFPQTKEQFTFQSWIQIALDGSEAFRLTGLFSLKEGKKVEVQATDIQLY